MYCSWFLEFIVWIPFDGGSFISLSYPGTLNIGARCCWFLSNWSIATLLHLWKIRKYISVLKFMSSRRKSSVFEHIERWHHSWFPFSIAYIPKQFMPWADHGMLSNIWTFWVFIEYGNVKNYSVLCGVWNSVMLLFMVWVSNWAKRRENTTILSDMRCWKLLHIIDDYAKGFEETASSQWFN